MRVQPSSGLGGAVTAPGASPASRRASIRAALTLAAAATLVAALTLLARPSTPLPEPVIDDRATGSSERRFGDIPLAFEPNAGRYGDSVDFTARAQSGSVALGEGGAILSSTSSIGAERASPVAGDIDDRDAASRTHTDAIAVRFPGAELTRATATERLPGVVNDLRGEQRSDHVTNIPTYAGVSYESVMPGIDLDFYGEGTALEYDFRLAPGADPSQLATRIAGADSLRLNAGGDLIARSGRTRFVQQAPVSFQPASAVERRAPVDSAFRLDGDRVSFELGAYDRSRPLVIDPVSLAYSTYLGGAVDDQPFAIAVDGEGAAYVTGYTDSTNFDTEGPIESDSTARDAFVSKLAPTGDALEYSTYLGGTGADTGFGIAVDETGAAYVAGHTESADFNSVGAIEAAAGGEGDAFISKLTPTGDSLAYSTHLGGTGYDEAYTITVDAAGAAYVGGYTESSDFNLVGAYEGDPGGSGSNAFVSKLAPSGSQLAYSTYLGGQAGNDAVNGIAVDASGAAFVAGTTSSGDFDFVNGYELPSGETDAFVSKFSPSGSILSYSTNLGGTGFDEGFAIAIDADGSAYVAGATASSDFDTVDEIEGRSGGGADAFVSKLAASGNALEYSTYLGGAGGQDAGTGIAVDDTGAAYVGGYTESRDFDTLDPYERASGPPDAFVSKLAASGDELIYSTAVGGAGNDGALGLAIDAEGAAYITGDTASQDFDEVGEIEGDSGGTDLFVTKLNFVADTVAPDTGITQAPPKTIKTRGRAVSVRFAFRSDDPRARFECSLDGAGFKPCRSPLTERVARGRHAFAVRAVDPALNRDSTPAKATFTVKRKRKRG